MKCRILFLAVLLWAGGCEILEENISSKQVEILGPADKAAATAGKIGFRWRALADASGYEFTLVSPSFAQAGRIVADTVIWADSLSRHFGYDASLEPGEYEWRITAFNSGYETAPQIRKLTIIPQPEE